MAEPKDQSAYGSVAGDGGVSRDGEGEESRNDGSEGLDHLGEAAAGVGLTPRDVEAVAEELAVSDGNEGGAAIDGLGVDLGESGEERVDERWAESVLVVIADQC